MSDATQNHADLAPSTGAKFRQRTLPILIFVAIILAIPMTDPSRTMLTLIHQMAINIVFALAYNMLLGKGGMLSFGHAVYFGLGGYFCMHVMNWIEEGSGIWGSYPTFFLPVMGFVAGGLAAAVIGSFSCRRAGTTFAMISLGVAELVFSGAFMFDSLFGGEQGINGDRMNGPEVFGLSMGPMQDIYWFMAFWTVVGIVAMYAFTRTPLGRLSEATRDNPQRVQFIGYNPTRVRWLVFTISGAFAGLAGGMSAVNYEIFTPEALSLIPSGFVLIMAYVGGITYFAGPIMGAILLTYMSSMMSDFTEAWLLYLGLMFVIIVMYAPRGIAGIVFGFWDGLRGAQSGEFLKRTLIQLAGCLLMLLGLIVLVEVSIRWSNGWGEVFEPYGMHFGHDSILTWIVIVVPIVAGAAILRYLGREKEEMPA
ncbi:possible branched-chain amino acid ABC transporter, permease protein [Pseudooceanicola batsensis HTCC2597]|uniref:Possible branched-chain amino acid ABC transporter, permease protein n=1 Tax=Pseudooceanicola batsensis (strain ATCC BAA-863 / DSM 15984 / KCTC 12145 / HTCC2597) TaxID=252305 RepID=A3TVZ0_PSEBH|nr:branched-chain amino acid ABC transporter permease [Pseudooceanicola batsensis]EAQ03786.1 possible branched-chain amino acid ABC transporter, permease protein [Pseudooceanicola batsensis HTCC2597]